MRVTNKKLFLMVLIFVIPLAVASLLYKYHAFFNLKTTSHGILLKTPLQVSYLYSQTEHPVQKQWRVIYISEKMCDEKCQYINHQLQQVKKALGKDTDRVSELLMNTTDPQVQKLKMDFKQQGNQNFVVSHKIYLIDPIGNLFMYYPDDTNPMNVLKDLKRVLEVSQIG